MRRPAVRLLCRPGFVALALGGRLTITLLAWRWWRHPGPRLTWTRLSRVWVLRAGPVVVSYWGGVEC